MPTSFPYTLITRTPKVERIIDAGRRRWPEKPVAAILVDLAEERVPDLQSVDTDPMELLLVFPTTGHTVTNEMIQTARADDW
jgi:hypothetical protein